jgi:hypothetical protein
MVIGGSGREKEAIASRQFSESACPALESLTKPKSSPWRAFVPLKNYPTTILGVTIEPLIDKRSRITAESVCDSLAIQEEVDFKH